MTRRGNGLTAEEYTPLADLTVDLADAVLAALREAGVAAYVASVHTPGRETPESGEPGQRLYVDATARGRAEYVLMDRLPGPREPGAETDGGDPAGPAGGGADLAEVADAARVDDDEAPAGAEDAPASTRDEDAIWREIVAGFDQDAPGSPSWPDRENIQDAGPRITAARIIRPAEPPLSPREPEPDADDDSDDEGHYVPPPPPPLPQADPVTKFAWIALAGGPLYLLLTAILQWDVPGWAAFMAVAAFVGGFVTLVLRMGDERRDDGPDDGAVV